MQNIIQNIADTWLEIRAVSRVLSWRDRLQFYRCFLKNVPRLIKQTSLRSLDACMNEKHKTLDIDCLGKRFHLAEYDFCSVREIYARRIYFPSDDWIPKQGDFVIDLGANVGMVTLLCTKLGADVVAVEAQDGFIPCIKKNLSENGCLDRVQVLHGLVGSGSGVFASEENFVKADHFDGKLPKSISMQEILDIHRNQRVHLLKMDIEGSEFDLFSSNLDWLSLIDKIAMEIHPDSGDIQEFIDNMTKNGFRCKLCTSTMRPLKNIPNIPSLLFCTRN